MSRQDFVGLGYISGVYGVRGWVKVFSYTQPRERIVDYSPWHLAADKTADAGLPDEAVKLESGRVQGKGVVVKLAGVDDRDAAAALIGRGVFVPRADLPEAEPGEYYWADLEGLRVVNASGDTLGHVDYLMETGAHDVLVLDGGANRLIPFVHGEVVLDVDLRGRTISVDWDPDWWE